MEGVILDISQDANVVHLMHGLPDFNITAGARTLETIKSLPVGYHVCVIDPGVGTSRKGLIIKTGRGDYLIGPDNGVLIPATRLLGGCKKIISITNPQYMRQPVSPIFHGRDVFSPAAAHLSIGVPLEEFGPEIPLEKLVQAPYEESELYENKIKAKVIQINKYGSIHLNILSETWDQFDVPKQQTVSINFGNKKIILPFLETFGETMSGNPLILKDDYGRVEVAVNMGNFAKYYDVKVGDTCSIQKE